MLLLVVVAMGYLLTMAPKVLLSDRTRQTLTQTIGVDLWKTKQNIGEQKKTPTLTDFGLRENQLMEPVTVFVEEAKQKIDGHVLSRGYDLDGLERVMIRGQFGGWHEVSLLAQSLGRRAFEIHTAGSSGVVWMSALTGTFGVVGNNITEGTDYKPYSTLVRTSTKREGYDYFYRLFEMGLTPTEDAELAGNEANMFKPAESEENGYAYYVQAGDDKQSRG